MKYRRRRYIVDSGFQWRFAACFILVVLAGSTASTAIFSFFALEQLESIQWRMHLKVQSTGEFLMPLFIHVNTFVLVFVCVLLILTWIIIRGKLRGPIYRLIKGLKQMVDGDLSSPIILRGKDAFKDVAEALDGMREIIREQFHDLQKEYAEISKGLSEMERHHALGNPISEKRKEVLSRVRKLLDKIDR